MTQLLWLAAVVGVVLALWALVAFVNRFYVKVPPNQVAVLYGRKHRSEDGRIVGFRLITGGGAVRIPVLEDVTSIDLNVIPIDLEVLGTPNKDGVLINVHAVANVKVLSDDASLMAACERFLHMKRDEIKEVAYKNLEGHLRSIIGRLTVEEIVSDRQKFNQEVLQEASSDLKKIGLGLDVLTVQKIEDEQGYIMALGRKRTAEVKRDATIGEAEAQREAVIKSTTAQRQGKATENDNLAQIAATEKERDVKKAQYLAQVQAEQARAGQAGPLAEAQAKQAVVQQQVEIERVHTLKEAEVAEAEAIRKEKELLGTVVKPAEANKQQVIIAAQAEQQALILRAEGEKTAKITLADAEKERLTREGLGAAEAIKAKLLAEAEGTKARLLAEAEGVRAKMLAEAEGIRKKAESFTNLDESSKILMILTQYPQIIEALAPVAGAVAAPMGNIDRLVVLDSGNNSGGDGALSRLANTVPATMLQMMQVSKALGIDLSGLLGKLGIQEEVQAPKPTS
jgi:flotillin